MTPGPAWAARRAGTEDVAVVAHLLHDFNTEYDTPSPGAPVLADRLTTLLARPDTVAFVGGEPAQGVALVTLRPNVWYAGPVALLDELYVVPHRRGLGLGSAIVEEMLRHLTSVGVDLVEISVDEGDVDAQRFYRRHGFSSTQGDSAEQTLYFSQEL